MSDTCISSAHIQKLGHEILEIRERALLSIKSKLERGYIFDNDLARSRELLSKLFDWFLLLPCTYQDLVLQLVKRILQSESGKLLQKHYGGSTIKGELEKIRTYLEPQYHQNIDDILQNIDTTEVPPLISSVPLSYRSDETFKNTYDSTATPIEGIITQKPSPELLTGCDQIKAENYDHFFKSCSLISQDVQVLQSIENSFRNPPNASNLLNSCEFFRDILLQDYPAEVFLQRPAIVSFLQGLLKDCPSTRLATAVLECLSKLTHLLIVRVNFFRDPSVYNDKVPSTSTSEVSTPLSEDFYKLNLNELKEADFIPDFKQISLQKFCFSTMTCLLDYICDKPSFNDDKMKLNRKQGCINSCVRLLLDLINLLSLCKQNNSQDVASFLNNFADTLEFFRIDLASNDSDPQQGIVYLSLLHICSTFLRKINPAPDFLPASFKIALENTLLNPIVTRLYSVQHDFLLDFLEKCNSEENIVKLSRYRRLKSICDSMSAAVTLLKEHKSKSFSENVRLAKNAILSLQFHRNLKLLKIIVETFATKTQTDDTKKDITGVILSLLSHHLVEVKQEMYSLCQEKVIAAVGPKLNVKKEAAPATQIIFLLQPEILIEIALNGLASDNYKIHASAEAILVYILKCKILVADKLWQKCIEAIIPALSVLLCYADRETPIGRTITGILDPDAGKSLFLTNSQILKGNIELLFAGDCSIRNEAVSRILWLLTQESSKDLLPKISSLEDRTLNSVCQLKIVYDVNKNRNTQHYYEPSNLKQVLKLLNSENVEPVIRRSALTQIGVMVEDPLLHRTFLENDGLRIMLCVMRSALTEKNYQDYPDSIVPAVGILKYLCLYNASVRHELSCNMDVYCFVLRGLLLYLTEEHMKEDCSVVLFLLIFHEHIKGTPSNADFSLPSLLFEKLKVPFTSQTYKTAQKTEEQENFAEKVFSDSTSLSALQLHWCLEWFGGVEEILKWDSVAEVNEDDFDGRLLLTNYGLMLLKNCSLEYCSRKYLIDVQNSTTHLTVFENVSKLTGCVTLFALISQTDKTQASSFYFLPWEKSLKKFLTVLPSGEADCTLLIAVLKFFSRLITLYNTEEAPCWITASIKNPKNCILELLEINTEEHSKTLAQELLNLIVKCVQQERNYDSAIETQSWGNVFKIIANTLKLSDSQNFYNLAFLDCMLSALVHITGMVGWSCCNQKDVIFRTITEICELLSVFHCGKGTTATDSVMGLSVTRNLLLLLNHLLAEIFNSDFKDWEMCFLSDSQENDNVLEILLQLLSSRDVVLRAAVLQLLCGLCTNARMALEVAREVVQEKLGIWEVALATLLDNEEASVVRENCATLLTNLCSHLFNKDDEDSKTKIRIVLNLLEDYDFYKQLKETLTNLFLKSVVINNNNFITTPALIKAVAKFLCNLTTLSKEDVISNLQEAGLIKQFFRSLSLPCASCENTKELALYRDVLEMNRQICVLLHKATVNEKSCASVLLHTRDCLSVLLSFLNPQLYYTYLPELIYLRNKLWNEIFGLLAVLVANATEFGGVIASCIAENYKEPFLQTLCESISSRHSEDLQQSALVSLTSLLNVEEENSVVDILDSFRTPRNLAVEKNLENIEPFNFKNTKFRTLEKVYFEKSVPSSYLKSGKDDFLLAGAEICKILLHLYHITTLNNTTNFKKRSTVISTLTSLLGVSKEAKTYAFCHGLLEITVQQIRELHIKLSLETVECTRRIVSKKRVCPLLKELDALIGLLTNFLLGCARIKNRSAELNLADLIHKLWVWFCFQKIELINVLKLLCTFTVEAAAPAQSLAFTSAIAGAGPRKTASNVTLLHAIVTLINREMEQISRTHDLTALKLSFEILENVCVAVECRTILAKSNLFGTFTRLHPAITKRQKPWDFVELLWLDFLQVFTGFPEGQAAVAKIPDVLDLILMLTASAKATNRTEAVYVLRNVAFYQPNRPRLLMSSEFLNVLCAKLEGGTMEEKSAVVSILWVLAANNQKAKLVLKCAGLDVKLQEILRQCHILEGSFNPCDVKRMHLVLKLLRDNDK